VGGGKVEEKGIKHRKKKYRERRRKRGE